MMKGNGRGPSAAVPWNHAVDTSNTPNRLSRITTQWSLVFDAHQGPEAVASRAQQALVQRYCGAIYRYLLVSVGDPDTADDLSQEFALRLVRGDFRNADPGRGRFRDFVKTALCHLIVDHRRRQQHRRHEALGADSSELAATAVTLPSDEEFLARWREELLNRAWEALARQEQEAGQPYYTVLRFRAENPSVRSAEMARLLGPRVGKTLTDVGIRQTLHRAREKFAELLLAEVGHSLQTDAPDRLEQELIDLDLLAYCRTALDRHARK
jgi:RNA polymerase sigma-70 factor (ECF subfamily)